jgi:hypothetical protein
LRDLLIRVAAREQAQALFLLLISWVHPLAPEQQDKSRTDESRFRRMIREAGASKTPKTES